MVKNTQRRGRVGWSYRGERSLSLKEIPDAWCAYAHGDIERDEASLELRLLRDSEDLSRISISMYVPFC